MKNRILPYDPRLRKLARYLRKNSTLSEILLWNCLKNKQIKGYDFHRQKPIDNYIVDFYSPELMLAIEIDGDSHRDERLEKDKERQSKIEQLGVSFLRSYDIDVKTNMGGVVDTITDWIEKQEIAQS
jgi:very-short-patch-repair endonuclease